MSYPHREKYYSHKFCRLLTKTAAAQELGPEACWLLTVIAHQEDSKRYLGPVTYWNEQLMPLCGFGSRERLVVARQKAVRAGWLHYDPGRKAVPGKYWTLIPPQYAEISDGPMDEASDDFCRAEIERQRKCRSDTERKPERHSDGNPNGKGPPFLPYPCPGNISTDVEVPQNGNRPGKGYSDAFLQWWLHYPRKVDKAAAAKAFTKTVATLVNDRDHPDITDTAGALSFLINAADRFAQTVAGDDPKFVKYPATWLNKGSFDNEQDEGANGRGRIATREEIEACGYTVMGEEF